jgi:hypothetical protein
MMHDILPIHMPERHIMEVLAYRIPEADFNAEYDREREDYLRPLQSLSDPERVAAWEQHFWSTFGGPWRYNQTVGAIRLYITGNQVRGELWLSNRKRFQRILKNRNISLHGSIFEMTVYPETANGEILEGILAHIDGFARGQRRLTFDLECLKNLGPFVDWTAMVHHGSNHTPARSTP